MNVNLTAIIKSHIGKEDALKQILLELVKGSRTEEACLQYDLHQAADEPNVFIFHEYGAVLPNWKHMGRLYT